jgi:hypothetical protein
MTRPTRMIDIDGADNATLDKLALAMDAAAPAELPELRVDSGNLPYTAAALRTLFAEHGRFFDRGLPVKVVRPADGSTPTATPLTVSLTVFEAHNVCRPIKYLRDDAVPVTLPDRVAKMYLEMFGEWDLQPLVGICTAPLLSEHGSIRSPDGYDETSGLWCRAVPILELPDCPTEQDALDALWLLRSTFRTFPFADAARDFDERLGVDVVDLKRAIGVDESAFLAGLLTAVCRPSLFLAPGLLLTAKPYSGAGTGKGLLVRCICAVAFGIRPNAFTPGNDRQELDKRLAAELIEASPALFLDNANGITLRSDTLASIMTERPCRIRVLGSTRMVPLNSTAFVAVTGNGLHVSEDLARRFLTCELDAQCEDPESRAFEPGFLEYIEQHRMELLTAALIIWRWGRQNKIKRGMPLGSFERWCTWVRDPLVALGCTDPVERIQATKANDPRRRNIADLFNAWWDVYGPRPIKAADLGETVRHLIDPQNRGRQFVATVLNRLTGTRIAGFVLTQQLPEGKWGATTYALLKTGAREKA